jgi:ribosomal protein S8
MGTAIVSTPQGLMTDRVCRERRLGGEVLLKVW